MPPKPRFNVPGIPQHIIQRGDNRDPCFYSEQDYRRYLDDLRESASKHHCRIHAYVLMTNHVHLLVTPMVENGVSQMMQTLARRYVKYFNSTYDRTGPLWQGRFKSSLIDSDIYLLTCMCYIELSPVRAQLVEHPGEYEWSSYKSNAQTGDEPFISYHPIYIALSETDNDRRYVYRELFQRHLDNDVIHQIRDALNHELVLGRKHFKAKIEEIANTQARLGKPDRSGVEEGFVDYYVFG